MKDTVLFFFSSGTHAGTALFSGAMRYARDRGWRLRLIDAEDIPTMRAAIRAYHPTGCLVGGHVDSAHERAALHPRSFHDIPVVYVDRDPDFFCTPIFCSVHDSFETGRMAALELLDLRLDSYAYVPWKTSVNWCQKRRDGFTRTLSDHGQNAQVFTSWKKDAHALERWLLRLPRPCGIFCASDKTAWDVILTAESCGLSIPEDIAIISVGNDPSICDNIEPGITALDPDFANGGYLAAELLDERIANPTMPPTIRRFRPLSVVRRGSTARFPAGDPMVKKALALIQERACNGLKASAVTAVMGKSSRRYAEQRFKRVTGKTILEAINELRLNRVQALLSKPAQKISAIANFCGWTSENSLRKFFRASTGMSMSEWRKLAISHATAKSSSH